MIRLVGDDPMRQAIDELSAQIGASNRGCSRHHASPGAGAPGHG
jgi:hypothetical protein